MKKTFALAMWFHATLIFAQVIVSRPFFTTTVDRFATFKRTHVQVSGRVTYVRVERDGDVHFRLTDEHGHYIVCEIVPYHPLPPPTPQSRATVRGIRRYDDAHRWWELNPVESWEVQP